MAKISSLVVGLSANSAKLNKDLAVARRRTKKFSKNVSNDFKKIGVAITAIITGATSKSILDITSRYEDLQTTLGSVFGSAKAGQQAFLAITKLSTKTQFGVEDLSKTFIKLGSSGIQPTYELLRTFTDAAAVTTDQVGSLEAITDLFSRTTSGGLGLEELNRLADRGIPVFDILEDKLGLARLEISNFGKSAEGANTILKALTDGINERFGGATQSRLGNLSTLMSNFKIQVQETAVAFGENLAPQVKQVVTELTEFLQQNEQLAADLGSGVGKAVIVLADSLKALIRNFDLLSSLLYTYLTTKILSAIATLFNKVTKAMGAATKGSTLLKRAAAGLKEGLAVLFNVAKVHPFALIAGAIVGVVTYFNGFSRTVAQVTAVLKYFYDGIVDLVSKPFAWLGEALNWINEKLGNLTDGVGTFTEKISKMIKIDKESDTIIGVWVRAGEEFDKAQEKAKKLDESLKNLNKTVKNNNANPPVVSPDGQKPDQPPPIPPVPGAGDGGKSTSTGLFSMKDQKQFSQALSSAIVAGIRDKTGWNGIKEAFSMSMQQYFFDEMQKSLESMIGDFVSDLSKSMAGSKTGSGGGSIFGDLLDWGASLFNFSKGGIVPQYLASGGMSRGTDTVPAMLTPGEVVLNAAQQKNLAGQLGGQNITINISGNVDQRSIDQIKRVVASDPVMIHQLNRNGENATTGLRRQQ